VVGAREAVHAEIAQRRERCALLIERPCRRVGPVSRVVQADEQRMCPGGRFE
jgi:hypothetical protein